jgi:hypothetical protein
VRLGVADACIVLVTYQRAADVRAVLERIERHSRSNHSLIVVDNHSDAELQKLLGELVARRPDTTVVRNFQNRWCGGATTQALRLVAEPYAIYLCSHECFVLEDGWDVRCLEFMDAHPRVALAGHRIASPAYADGRGYQALASFKHFRNPAYAERRANDAMSHVQGGFYVLRMRALRETGGFNPAVPHGHMDVEYSYFLESEGWELADLPFVNSIHSTTRPVLEGYVPTQWVYHPLTPEQARAYEEQAVRQRRAGRRCPVCDWRGKLFRERGSRRDPRPDSECPRCGSREEQRALLAHVERTSELRGARVLDLAPAPAFVHFFEQRGARYTSLERRNGARVRGEPAHLPFRAASFDLVLGGPACAAAAAQQELARVLAPGGRALLRDAPAIPAVSGVSVLERALARDFALDERVQLGFYRVSAGALELVRDA